MKAVAVAALALVFALPFHAAGHAEPAGVTLADLARSALAASPRLKAAQLELEAAQENIPLSRGRLLPRISANARHGSRQSNAAGGNARFEDEESSYGVNFEQALLNIADVNEYRKETRAAQAAEQNYGALRQDFLLELLEAWLDWHLAADRLRLLQSRMNSVFTQRAYAARLAGEKVGAALDVVLFDAETNELQADIERAESGLEAAAANLRRLANVDRLPLLPPGLIAGFAPPFPEPAEEWNTRVLASNPRLLAAGLLADEALLAHRAAKARHLPTISLVGQASGDKADDQTFVGLQVEFPISSGGQISAQSRQAMLLHNASLSAEKDLRRQLLADSGIRRGEAAALVRSAESLEKATEDRIKYLDKATLAWKEGFASATDVLEAQERLFNTEIQLRAAYYNYLREMAHLHALAGTLDQRHLEQVSGNFAPTAPPQRSP